MSNFINFREFDNKVYKVCISIKEKTEEEIRCNLLKLDINKIDLIEWRVDYYDDYDSIDKVLDTLIMIKNNIGNTPLLFTFKNKSQGGLKDISIQYYIKLIKSVANINFIDIVNLELSKDYGVTNILTEFLYNKNIKVILPKHSTEYNLCDYKIINI